MSPEVIFKKLCPARAEAANDSESVLLHLYGPNHQKPLTIKEQSGKKETWRKSDLERLARSADFNVSRPTLIYLGGWHQQIGRNWLLAARETRAKLAAAKGAVVQFNMLLFDWLDYSYLYYFATVSRVAHLGRALGQLLQHLVGQLKHRASQIHLLAYSMSTHIAGLAGRQLQAAGLGQVAQITAIDPTGVCFHVPLTREKFGEKYALRPSDAKLVLARHYDMDFYGSRRPIGGLDVWVNDGRTQPKMGRMQTDHRLAAEHEASMTRNWDNQRCYEVAYECDSYEKFRRGQCADCGAGNKSCLVLGTVFNTVRGHKVADVGYRRGTRMYLTTGPNRFCVHHYQIVAKLKANSSSEVTEMFRRGQVEFKLASKVAIRPRYEAAGAIGGASFTSLLRIDRDGVQFSEHVEVKSLELLQSLESISANYMSGPSAEIRNERSVRFCPHKSSALRLTRCVKLQKTARGGKLVN